MTHLWIQNRDGFWQEHDLADGAVTLSTNGPAPTDSSNKSGNPSQPMLVPHSGPHGSETWVLLAGPLSRMRINGLPIPVGIRVLTDRDAITLDAGHTFYFSSEQLAETIPFSGPGSTSCVRCKLPIEPGSPAVRCPGSSCGFWYHQSDDRPCWTYTDTCVACHHPTDLDAGLRWSPAEL